MCNFSEIFDSLRTTRCKTKNGVVYDIMPDEVTSNGAKNYKLYLVEEIIDDAGIPQEVLELISRADTRTELIKLIKEFD